MSSKPPKKRAPDKAGSSHGRDGDRSSTRSSTFNKAGPSTFQEKQQTPMNESVFDFRMQRTAISEKKEEDVPETDNEEPSKEERGALGRALDALKSRVETIARGAEGLSSDGVDVLKEYIALKESETRDIKEQNRQYEKALQKMSSSRGELKSKLQDAINELEVLKKREESARRDILDLKQKHEESLRTLQNDYEERVNRAGKLEIELSENVQKKEAWKEKVQEDLKKIRLREREIENKYELLKRDMQALLDSKDKHVLDLKKKVDALELELETLEEKLRSANTILSNMDAKKQRLIQTLKLATTLLEEIDAETPSSSDIKRKASNE